MIDRLVENVGKTIFAIRWLLAPMYLLLYVALTVYIAKYSIEVFRMMIDAWDEPNTVIMLGILELIDMTMIANLVVMTTTGGYSIFIREFKEEHDRPRWLSANFSSSEQKVKLIMSLIGVADVTLLHDFIKTNDLPSRIAIIMTFIVSGFAYCYFNKLMHTKSH